jgi:hypothetical protein
VRATVLTDTDKNGLGRNRCLEDDKIAVAMKPIARYLEEKKMTQAELISVSGLDAKIVKAIVAGSYTPSPAQRERLSAALGLTVQDIEWGHTVAVQHIRGNGPQVGRST